MRQSKKANGPRWQNDLWYSNCARRLLLLLLRDQLSCLIRTQQKTVVSKPASQPRQSLAAVVNGRQVTNGTNNLESLFAVLRLWPVRLLPPCCKSHDCYFVQLKDGRRLRFALCPRN